MFKNRITSAAAGAVAATVIAAGVAWATIPAADGIIHGCYQKAEGQLRVIDVPAQQCRPSEIPISWNAVGPQGLQGPPGQDGEDGADGLSVTTANESAGPNCENGGASFVAANGTTYACNGTNGTNGTNGVDGTDGIDGTDGTDGTDGIDGTDGTDGTDGISVISAMEPAGTNCADGGSRFTAASGVTFACNGAPGGAGLGGFEVVEATKSIEPLASGFVQATCPAGKVPLQGTVDALGGFQFADIRWQEYFLSSGGNFLIIVFNNSTTETRTYRARVSCVTVAP